MHRARADQGVAEWTHAGGERVTLATTTCCHCNTVTFLTAKPDDCGGFCRLCMKPTCSACADKSCVPFEKRLERAESRGRLFAALGL
jgi:hypothetical protein